MLRSGSLSIFQLNAHLLSKFHGCIIEIVTAVADDEPLARLFVDSRQLTGFDGDGVAGASNMFTLLLKWRRLFLFISFTNRINSDE